MFRGVKWLPIGVLALILPFLAACDMGSATPTPKPTLIVASKAFTEEELVGEMYAQLLEAGGYPVTRKLNLGETSILHPALEKGDIHLYPEYTGTGLVVQLGLPPNSDPQQVYEAVSKGYQERFKMTWLDPAPMNNTQALVTTRENSEKFGIKTLSDLAAKSAELRLACVPAFTERPDGLPGLQQTYGGFAFKELKQVDFALLYPSLLDGAVDVTQAGGSTDGEIEGYGLVLLEDDKKLFPVYQLAPVLLTATVDQNPDIKTILNPLAPKLTDSTMRRLNWEVAGKKREAAEVAKEFLTTEGLLK
jgi:osmoprotectant transport system substrate-binding protein